MASSLSVIGLSLVSISASAQLLFYDAIIVDELGLGGDAIATYMFLVILFFSFLNFFIYVTTRNRTKGSNGTPPQ